MFQKSYCMSTLLADIASLRCECVEQTSVPSYIK